MLDWYVIQYLYPNAVERFKTVMFPNSGLISLSILEYYDIKKLYRFFDTHGIYLTVEMLTKDVWLFTVSTDNGVTFAPCHETKTKREDIEAEGFYECFRLLEKRLRLDTYI